MLPMLVLALLGYSDGPRAATLEEPGGVVQTSTSSIDDIRRNANRLWSDGKMAEAAGQYRTLVASDGPGASDNPHLVADSYALGSLLVELDRLEEAKAYFHRALALSQGHPLDAAEVEVSLGGVLAIQGAFVSAEANLTNAIAAFNQFASPNDLRAARALSALGWLYTVWGKVDKAADALEKARSMAEKVLPPESLGRVHFMDYQASYLTAIGRYSEAENLWLHAVAIVEKMAGTASPRYDSVFLHLGQMYEAIEDYKSAQEMLERFLVLEKQFVPAGSLAQAIALGELGNTCTRLREYQQAASRFASSLDMLDRLQDKVPLDNAIVVSYLGDFYMTQHRWSDAEIQYERALQTRQKLIPDSPLVAGSMSSLSKALEKLKRKDEAKRYQQQARAILAVQKNPVYSGDTVDVKSFRAKQ